MFAIRLVMACGVLFLGTVLASAAEDVGDEYVNIEAKGIIKTDVVAIGGETTGTTLTAKKTTLELEIKDPKLQTLAKQLNGKSGVVKGQLRIQQGVEIPIRIIVEVSDLKASK